MIIIGLFNVLYNAAYQIWNTASGVDFTIPAKVSQVWDYIMNLLSNGKAIISLFLDLPYVYFLVEAVLLMWEALLFLELVAWIFRLIKLQI